MATNYTVQTIFDSIKIIPELAPIFNKMVSGSSLEPELTIANEVWARMFETTTMWKYNEIVLPPFYLNSLQQDYAGINLKTRASVTNLASLQSGDTLDVNNTATCKTNPQVEVVRQLPRTTGAVGFQSMPQKYQVCAIPNAVLYYGTWGAPNTGNANSNRGNNPVANSVYTSPIGNGIAMPSNPITQILDANGNYLVLTTYGYEGSAAPAAPAASAAGTTCSGSGATTVWTVVDPQGAGFRILPAPSQSGVVWQFNLIGQAKPPVLFSNLDTLISPVTDDWAYVFRLGCIAVSYRYAQDPKITAKAIPELALWEQTLMKARVASDKEPESYYVIASSIVAPVGGQMPTPANPFSWPYGS